ncbi:hypothetical protein FCV82_09040 [Vibrio breoganii]|uniref:hypothetical protein n=1 Tax=Vibrio breoganii TaxID=553239 RepID=UPI00101AD4D2|nr:hypothetical protein [Vibrio breoganii]TKF87833.1 hypothetical protein FCV82_09040 [Vibrio breoganii]TKG15013.1 hypothetical protein FCV84_10950 [Vibrio breoganii]
MAIQHLRGNPSEQSATTRHTGSHTVAIQYLRDNSSQQSAKPAILETTLWLSSTLETTHLSKA